ncbi:hypothetical protein H5410_029924 [Solanum commersonii]|uniref:Wall-associated receptor kinase C-terminal domain-containing protein n=1 Tax=Solanum commersonii TaxID=4109 RepID=A0A9J5YEA6_SOLCO|nr:hypothetical protein H5410_029924 [Solanum commersonii]
MQNSGSFTLDQDDSTPFSILKQNMFVCRGMYSCKGVTGTDCGGDEGDPMKWEFRISLLYNDSYYVDESCKNCEDSGASCGFFCADESFACICRRMVS